MCTKGFATSDEYLINYFMIRIVLIVVVMACTWGIPASVAQGKKSVHKLFELAQEANDHGEYTRSLELLNELLTINPGFTEAYFTRASVREQLNDPAGAITDYS